MSEAEVRRDGLHGVHPGREARTGVHGGRRKRGGRGERAMVPDAEFSSYYGRPIIKPPSWSARDIAGYLFLGGLAGASSMLGAGGDLSGRPALARAGRVTGLVAISGSFAALVHDLGRPERFLNMLRMAKPTSPMSMGTWLLTGYGPAAGAAGAAELLGVFPRGKRLAGGVAAMLAPAVATYTSVLIADTAVPAWHDAYPELPFVFAGSSAASAAGVGLLGAPVAQNAPARKMAVFGGALELAAARRIEQRLGLVGEAYRTGRAGRLLRAARWLTAGGVVGGALLGRRSRLGAAASGAALLAGAVCERFGIFEAGVASAKDPKYTVIPQRERVAARATAR